MSLLTKLLLATTMFAGACSPAVTQHHDAGPRPAPIVRPIETPAPRIDRAALRAALATRRQDMVARFLGYRENRVYPVNTFTDGYGHVWLDAQGNLCAAATLISADWGRAASERVAGENNFLQLADVHDGPLLAWMLTSGLTHHEIVAIQAPGIMPDGRVVWDPIVSPQPEVAPDPRIVEVERLYNLYVDVERQLTSMWDTSLDDATDALLDHSDLARALLDGVAAGPGRYGETQNLAGGFAQPPPA